MLKAVVLKVDWAVIHLKLVSKFGNKLLVLIKKIGA